jgi:hypothetical protein
MYYKKSQQLPENGGRQKPKRVGIIRVEKAIRLQIKCALTVRK